MTPLDHAFAALHYLHNHPVMPINRVVAWKHFRGKPERKSLYLTRNMRLNAFRDANYAASYCGPYGQPNYGAAVLTLGLGNCYEQACAAAWYLETHGGAEYALMHYSHNDHVFLALGQPRGVYPDQFKQWSADAAICDPWADIACPAREYSQRWRARMSNWQVMGLTIAFDSPRSGSWYDLVDEPKCQV